MILLPKLAKTGYFAVKHKVDQFDKWPAWQRVRRGFQAPVYRIADTGLFGLTPLQTHILICGFPGSGTTLLQLMIENGLPHARRFGRERSGWKAATYSRRNHSVLISKQPRDLLRLQPLRDFYRGRPARLKVIVMIRDPRDLMTVRRECGQTSAYSGCPQLWKTYYDALLRERDQPDTLVVRFEDLIGQTHSEQMRIEAFVGHRMAVPFAQTHEVPREDFDHSTLRGLRPPDPTRIARWKQPAHRQRINEVMQWLPELPEALIGMGYEAPSSGLAFQPQAQGFQADHADGGGAAGVHAGCCVSHTTC
jgi:hypothetical protein